LAHEAVVNLKHVDYVTQRSSLTQAKLEAELHQELAGYGADPASGRMTDRQYEVSFTACSA